MRFTGRDAALIASSTTSSILFELFTFEFDQHPLLSMKCRAELVLAIFCLTSVFKFKTTRFQRNKPCEAHQLSCAVRFAELSPRFCILHNKNDTLYQLETQWVCQDRLRTNASWKAETRRRVFSRIAPLAERDSDTSKILILVNNL